MRDPLLRLFFSRKSFGASAEGNPRDSWLNRVRENLAQVLLPSSFKPSTANGAPIHLLQFEKSRRSARAQGLSLLTHFAVFALILLLLKTVTRTPPPGPISFERTPLSRYHFPVIRTIAGAHPSDGSGNGGDHNPIPPTSGAPPPRSSVQLVKPTLPSNQNPVLPEPPTILDPNAPAVLNADKIGLVWMPEQNDSTGPGAKHAIGTGPDGDIGTGGPGPYGNGYDSTAYGPGFIAPMCAYCPYPTYSDDARKAKVQGAVTLRVLVGADGRAHDVRMVKGIGFGLDDRAIETVRNWKFVAARDSAKRSVASWVTVEAVFRLF